MPTKSHGLWRTWQGSTERPRLKPKIGFKGPVEQRMDGWRIATRTRHNSAYEENERLLVRTTIDRGLNASGTRTQAFRHDAHKQPVSKIIRLDAHTHAMQEQYCMQLHATSDELRVTPPQSVRNSDCRCSLSFVLPLTLHRATNYSFSSGFQ